MDIEKYISSGILEAYALGELPPAERAEVEEVVSRYPEIKAELAEIEVTMEAIAMHTAVAPDKNLRAKVLGKALGNEAYTAPKPTEEEEGRVVPMPAAKEAAARQSGRSNTYTYYLAAAISFAVLTSAAAVYFFGKWQDAEDRLYVVVAERTAMAQNYKTVENQLDSLSRELAIYASDDFNEIKLQGLAIAPEAGATVFWNRNSNEVFLNPANLPEPPQGKQYQLWAIVDGKPVDMGMVTSEKNGGLLKMKEIENAAAFAITLEPAGGSPSPTMEQMYVMGETASS